MTLADFLRSFSSEELAEYFQKRGIDLGEHMVWSEGSGRRVSVSPSMLDKLGPGVVQRVLQDAERVGHMADDAGQAAIDAVAPYAEESARSHRSSHARCLWFLLHRPTLFERCEEVRFTDDRRLGHQWDSFITDKGIEILRTAKVVEGLRKAIADHFDSKRTMVEICDRTRLEDESTKRLIQIAIYREGRAELRRQFTGDQLEHVPTKPVVAASLTYEPDIGVIEVVARTKVHRLSWRIWYLNTFFSSRYPANASS
ncbi:hypothetical protein [Roseococcus sp.]|uniref:hypothetical protein n=1 Tax=Roseococcus sp. TaxID=2109646 RepID=UPI003BABC4A7